MAKGLTTRSSASIRGVCFGTFEFEPDISELRKHGLRIKLRGQPIEVLTMLLQHPGEAVTREDLQKRLWPADTYVDFEHSLNAAMKRLWAALGDSADPPKLSLRPLRLSPQSKSRTRNQHGDRVWLCWQPGSRGSCFWPLSAFIS